MSTENRDLWYKRADEWEAEFINKYGLKLDIIINPAKKKYKTAPDLYLLKSSQSADLKVLNIPFFTSNVVFGIPPQYCWTFNPSDLFEYAIRYPDNFGIIVWKNFENSEKYGYTIVKEESVYYLPLFDIKKMVIKTNKIHHYIRRMNDTNGNSFGSYGFDLRKFHKII